MVTFVREGKKVAPTCPACGCRFEITKMTSSSWNDDGYVLSHFEGNIDRDARGCICPLLDEVFIAHQGVVRRF